MVPAYTYFQILDELKQAFTSRYKGMPSARMVGLLFAPPHTRIAKEEIIPRLQYFHHRSGNNIDFFCAGYGAYLPPQEYPDMIEVIEAGSRRRRDTSWAYSNTVFINLCKDIGQLTRWRYSGEADLIMANARFDLDSKAVSLDFSTAVVLDLELMLKDEAILSVGRLFENICQYADHYHSEDPTYAFSDRRGINTLGSSIIDGIVDSLPKAAGLLWKRGRHYRSINLEL